MNQNPGIDETADPGTAGQSRLAERIDDERGDVPGWVLVTVMTAGLVVVLLRFAETELLNILTAALRSVTP